MNIPFEKAYPFIGDEGFYTPQEVIEYTKNTRDPNKGNTWEKVLNRTDVKEYIDTLSPEKVFELSDDSNATKITEIVLKRKGIKPIDLISFSKRQLAPNYMGRVLRRDDVQKDLKEIQKKDALNLVKGSYSNDIAISVLKREDITPEEIMSHLKEYHMFMHNVWASVSVREDMQEYLRTVKVSEAVAFANGSQCENAYKIVFNRADIKPKELIEYVRKIHTLSPSIWEPVLKREDVKKYLSKMSPDEALKFAERFSADPILKVILSRKDILLSDLIKFAKKDEWYAKWEIILCRPDIPLSDAYKYAKGMKIDDVFVGGVWMDILKRPDVSGEESILQARKMWQYSVVMDSVLGSEKALTFLRTAPKTEILAFAKKVDSHRIWDIVLERPDMATVNV